MKKIVSIITLLMISALSMTSSAQAANSSIELAQRWDAIKYQITQKDDRIVAYETLIADAKTMAAADNNSPAPKVWAAITLATLAGEVGAMGGALDKVTEAKALLETALKQNPNREVEASIHTTLGSLYYQVPGWPIGFGDEDKAVKHLKKALELSPQSLAANFWMGSYLLGETRKREEAGQYFIKAIAAPARAGRARADKGRKAEAAEILAKIEKKLRHKIKLAHVTDQTKH